VLVLKLLLHRVPQMPSTLRSQAAQSATEQDEVEYLTYSTPPVWG